MSPTTTPPPLPTTFLALPDATIIHVARGTDGHVSCDPVDMTAPVEGLTAQLGLNRADVLSAIRWFIYVEGEHDVAVLNAMFANSFVAARALVIPMHGASHVEAQITSEQLIAYSDARIRIVLDRAGEPAMTAWETARTANAAGNRDAAKRAFTKLVNNRDRESKWLAEAGLAALNRGTLDRIDVVGLERHDIIHYLPVDSLVPGATSWIDLSTEWHRVPPPRPAFKEWLRQKKGARIESRLLGEIAQRVTDRQDLIKVIEGL